MHRYAIVFVIINREDLFLSKVWRYYHFRYFFSWWQFLSKVMLPLQVTNFLRAGVSKWIKLKFYSLFAWSLLDGLRKSGWHTGVLGSERCELASKLCHLLAVWLRGPLNLQVHIKSAAQAERRAELPENVEKKPISGNNSKYLPIMGITINNKINSYFLSAYYVPSTV